MSDQGIEVISDSHSRKLQAVKHPTQPDAVLVTRIWKNPFKITTVGMSLTELEAILKRFNGGERNG